MSDRAPSDPQAERATAASSQWAALPTEARHPASGELDRLPGERIVELLLDEDRQALAAARCHGPQVARAAAWLAESFTGSGTVLFAGAGTSGRLGVLEAAECPPTFGSDPQRIRAVIAGGPEAVFAAREGAEDRLADGRRAAAELGPGDLLVGISASSVTPYVRGALQQATAGGARTVLVTCAGAAAVTGAADLVIALDTGPEILTGSTRLKAGSVTKAVLNAMTTAAMVSAGKVFENLMVDLRPGSAKLVDRSQRIIQAATGVGREHALELHREADGEVKTAIVMARCACTADEARRLLAEAGGHVRGAIEAGTGGRG